MEPEGTAMALMANVTYKPVRPSLRWNEASPSVPVLRVFLDGSHAGTIFRRNGAPGGYYYRPRGTDTSSKLYPTLDELKASLQRQGT
jgi:hypothetical protein